jgi:acetylornithine deacetylase
LNVYRAEGFAEVWVETSAESKLPEWTKLFQSLVRSRGTFEVEHEVIATVERRLGELGLSPIEVPFDPERLRSLPGAQRPFSSVSGRRNIVVQLDGSEAGRSLVLNSHMDIVPAGEESSWQFPPFAGSITDNFIYGRGAHDDKAGVLLCLAALEILKEHDLLRKGRLTVQFVLEDEITGNGSLLCLAAGHVADAAIIVDGTRGDTGINEHAGQIQFSIELRGLPASVSVSHLGLNAAEMLARLMLELRQAVFDLNIKNIPPWDRYPSPNQFVVQSLSAAGEPLTVPVKATGSAYLTFTPPATVDEIRTLLEATAAKFSDRFNLSARPIFDWSGFMAEPVSSASAELERAIGAAAKDGGMGEVTFGPSTGTSDMRHFAARGIPCVLFGPGRGFNPHRPDERYDLSSILPMLGLLIRTVTQWCSGP